MDQLAQARAFIDAAQPSEAIRLLRPLKGQHASDSKFLSVLGEAYLEDGKVEKAFKYLHEAIVTDPQGVCGAEKFLYVGQIVGGVKGLELIDQGISLLQGQVQDNSDNRQLLKKINGAVFAKIEIWMTDLCMEPEAEQVCNELIQHCLEIDETNPETWSLLASIRISQQLDDDALKAIDRSWELFQGKKLALEEQADGVIAAGSESDLDVNTEYIELIQPLLTLSRFCIELGNYELGGLISSTIRDIDSNNLESLYIEAFSNYLILKKNQYYLQYNQFNPELFENFKVDLNKIKTEEEHKILQKCKVNFSMVLKIHNNNSSVELDQDILQHTRFLVNELGGAIEVSGFEEDEEDDDVNEENWQDVIESDNE
jgi:tetratricopeptide (TPR) repeat protein